uniref:ATP synthase complex subunit 8 n=2 Tax=Scolytinae TaxID=55867 RepID=A0A7G7CEN7_9CUCU|nr:ATP synthase F0 subunit 8 [Trypophloeus asperatus]AOY40101.1 ATP synthase F0 subunit 8 [Trypophloeus asperatus]QNE86053.1 ATP synthase F0 subunit 8 [Cryphalus abietis]
MPQMAPLNWLTLFMYFSIIFLLTSVLLYTSFQPNQQSQSFKIFKTPNLNWKW